MIKNKIKKIILDTMVKINTNERSVFLLCKTFLRYNLALSFKNSHFESSIETLTQNSDTFIKFNNDTRKRFTFPFML